MDNTQDESLPGHETLEAASSNIPEQEWKTAQRGPKPRVTVKKQRATPAAVTATYTQRQQLQQTRVQNQGDFQNDGDGSVHDNDVVGIVQSRDVDDVSVDVAVAAPVVAQYEEPADTMKTSSLQENTIIRKTEDEPLSVYASKDDILKENHDDEEPSNQPVRSGYASIHRSSVGRQNDLPDDMEELKKLVRQYQAQVRQSTGSSPEAFISNVEATARLRIQLQQKLDSERHKYDALLDENRRLALRIKELDKGVLPNYDAELQNRANQTVILHKKIKELTKERNQFQELYQKAVKRSEAEAQTLQKLHKDLSDTKQANQRVVATLNAELTELRQKHQSLQMKIIELTRLLESEQKQRATAENQMIALKSKAEHYFAHSVVNEVRGANKYEEIKKRKTSQSHSQLPDVFRQKNTGAIAKQSETTNRSELPQVFNPKAKSKAQQDMKQSSKAPSKIQQPDPKQKPAQQKQAQNDKSNARKPSMTNPAPNGKQVGQPSKIPLKEGKSQKQVPQPAQQDKKGNAQKGNQQAQAKGANNKQLQLTKSQQQLKVVMEYNAWVPKNGKKK